VLLTRKLSAGVVHLDEKLEDMPPLAKVCDFGVAKMLHVGSGLTPRAHSVGGTEIYMAPEVASQRDSGNALQTVMVDQWAFAVVSLETLQNDRGVQSRDQALRLLQDTEDIVTTALRGVLDDDDARALVDILKVCGDDEPSKRKSFEIVSDVLLGTLRAVLAAARKE
jgi:serine/threonine protein kinase